MSDGAILYGPSLNGYAEVARIQRDGKVAVVFPARFEELSHADLVTLTYAMWAQIDQAEAAAEWAALPGTK